RLLHSFPTRRSSDLSSSKIFYCTKVVAYGIFCIITTLEFFQHHFSQMGHREPSYDPHLHHNHRPTNAPLPHAKRPPPGGYVQTRLPVESDTLKGRIVQL